MAKKILISLVLLLTTSFIVNAQFNRKRLPYTQDEIKLLFKKAIKEHAFADDIFETTEVPEQWKNESAVILGRKIRYEGNVNPWNNIGYLHYSFRARIKLQDKYAVESYSEYYFSDNDIVEITIIKPDGKTEKVDLDDAIEVKDKIPNYFNFGEIEITRYKKLAIPNLEPGDIIDVMTFDAKRFNRNYYHWTDPLTIWWPLTYFKVGVSLLVDLGYSGSFDGERLLNDDYNVVGQKLEFDLGRSFYLNFRSLNGAPDITQEKSKSRSRKLWVFTDNNREKLKEELFSEPMYTLPAIKYEINFLNRRARRKTDRLIDKKYKIKTTINNKDLKKLTKRFVKESKPITGNIYYDFYKKEGRKISNDKQFIEAFYNYYRTTKLYEIARISDEPPYEASISNKSFTKYLTKILRKRNIPYSILIGVPKSAGGIDGLISYDDVMWGVKIYFQNDEVIYTDCDFYAQPGEVNPAFEGTKLYEVKPAYFKSRMKVTETDIPVTPARENKFVYTITANFQSDLDTLQVQRVTHLTGMPRYRYKSRTFPYNAFFEKEKEVFKTDKLFVTQYLYDKKLLKNKNFLNDEEQRIAETRINLLGKNAQKQAEKDIKYDYQLVSYDTLKVKQSGLEVGNPDIIFEERYKLRDLMDAIDNNTFVLKVGEFIDSQIEVKDKDDRERQGDIVLPYSRSFLYEIEINIPGGLTVEGVEQLNRSADNETGSFQSNASISGSVLKIRVEKVYKGNFHSKDKWTDLLKFIDEAVDFRSVKLILKR